jgi:hypothetical protein
MASEISTRGLLIEQARDAWRALAEARADLISHYRIGTPRHLGPIFDRVDEALCTLRQLKEIP